MNPFFCCLLLAVVVGVKSQPVGRLHSRRFREAGGSIRQTARQDNLQGVHTPNTITQGTSSITHALGKDLQTKLLVITESLDNGLSEYQDDIQGQVTFGPGQDQAHSMPYHPTGNTIETFWNPFALGHNKPNAFPGNTTPHFPGPYPVVGLNKGSCISLTGGNDCGEWECRVYATFYNSSDALASCFPPSSSCVATQAQQVLGSVHFSGIWPSCASPNEDFQFQLAINGGTGPFVGAAGHVVATQFTDYHFTYELHFL